MSQALVMLINIVFDLYLWAIILRIILQWQRADYHNPLSQLVITLTEWPLKLFYTFLKYKKGLDLGALLFAFIVALIKVALLIILFGLPLNPAGLALFAALDLLQQLLSLYFYIILIVTLASWLVRSGQVHPVLSVLHRVVEPVLKPFRRYVPVIAGFDFSPLIALILIKFIEIIVMKMTLGL